MNKHTPGPWVVGRVKAQEAYIDAPSGDANLKYDSWTGLAIVNGCDDDPIKGSAVMEANALLIAAAPELLEALIDIREWCQNAKTIAGVEPYGLSVAERAIAKATGEK